ncbi:MAG: hypothetical protein AAFR90_11210 [Pseudomonadota bacterium]
MSQDVISSGKITKQIVGPVQSMRWNIVNGAFVLQMAKEAAVFEDDKFLKVETVWLDVPIVDNAGRTEPSRHRRITTAEIVEEG